MALNIQDLDAQMCDALPAREVMGVFGSSVGNGIAPGWGQGYGWGNSFSGGPRTVGFGGFFGGGMSNGTTTVNVPTVQSVSVPFNLGGIFNNIGNIGNG